MSARSKYIRIWIHLDESKNASARIRLLNPKRNVSCFDGFITLCNLLNFKFYIEYCQIGSFPFIWLPNFGDSNKVLHDFPPNKDPGTGGRCWGPSIHGIRDSQPRFQIVEISEPFPAFHLSLSHLSPFRVISSPCFIIPGSQKIFKKTDLKYQKWLCS